MLIDGGWTAGKLEHSFKFFDEMVKNGIDVTLVTCNALINGHCKMGRVIDENMVSQITSGGYNPDVITYNFLISGYSKIGNVKKCLSLYENMKNLGIKPTLNMYHPLISACGEEDMVLVVL